VPTYVLSSRKSFVETIRAALKTDNLKAFASAGDVVPALLTGSRTNSELLVIDLESVPDAGRLIDFVKSSAPIRAIRILVVGTAEQLTPLGPMTSAAVDAIVQAPCTQAEIAAAAAKPRQDIVPGGLRSPDVPPGEASPANSQ
jgi:hypothetical protein